MADKGLSVTAKPWTPGSGGATFGAATGTAPVPTAPVPTPTPAFAAAMPMGVPLPLPPAPQMPLPMYQPMMPAVGLGVGGVPMSVSVGMPSVGFIPTITASMPTRAPLRIPRGRGNSGRGLRAQQEMKQQAANTLPTYAAATGADVAEESALDAEEDAVYNPLAPVTDRTEEERAAFHTRAALDVLGDDAVGASPSLSLAAMSTRTTPKIVKSGVIGSVIGSSNATPSIPKMTPVIAKPNPAPVVSVGGVIGAPPPFHFAVTAKPFVPPPGGFAPPSSGSLFAPPSGGFPSAPPVTNATPDASSPPSDDDEGPLDGEEVNGEGGDLPKCASEALRVDADTFFTEKADEAQVRQAALALQKTTENPYSITSLQGVRATMPSIERAQWYPLWVGHERVDVPAPFICNAPTPPGADPHANIHIPPQYPRARLGLYAYQCLACPIRCQLSKINDRPPDLKLGGICGDINPACIAHLVVVLSGVQLDALDVFGHNFGRCNLWLHDPADAPRMMAALDRRVWMSPVPHGYAVVVDDEDSREYLLWYLEGLREHGPRRVRFPRHLMTCEKWIV